jgi:hypothetical protein
MDQDFDIRSQDCDEEMRVEDPRCADTMNNKNLKVMRPGEIVQGVQERIVYV